ncbi:MAG: hypothetical protein HKM06_02890 [Spirochaetales bacterium]|nr:hypothetical protein [Spirochaetales bacterium]
MSNLGVAPLPALLGKFFFWMTKPFHFLKDNPVLYRGRHFNIVFFGVFAALEAMSILLAFVFYLGLRGAVLAPVAVPEFLLLVVFVWIGARLFHLFALGKKFLAQPRKYLLQTGFYVQGGLVGLLVWCFQAAPVLQISIFTLMDGLLWAGALGQFWGRLGCFNYGCCFGKPTHQDCGVSYHNEESKVLRWRPDLKGKPLHPTQLYTAYANLFVFIVFLFLLPLNLPTGFISMSLLAAHGLLRIFIETLREDIYFHGKRNGSTLRFALASLVAAGLLGFVGHLVDPFFLESIPFRLSPSWSHLFVIVGSRLYLEIAILGAGLVAFLGYGIHGKTLGQFPVPVQLEN